LITTPTEEVLHFVQDVQGEGCAPENILNEVKGLSWSFMPNMVS
jgi:hypothetical protein